MRRKLGILVMMAVVLGVIVVSQTAGEQMLEKLEQRRKIPTAGNTAEAVVVIDSGHGGADPGKIGINKAEEKEINLQIALKVQKKLKENHVKVIMTRTGEEGMKESRAEDLKARVELINQAKPVLAVSIHQNSYPEEGIHGAQVFFYTHSEEGKKAAETLQEALLRIDPKNHRQAKANDTYYMLKKTETPVVIAECGFLSNPEEAALLCEEAYQMQVAQALVEGILNYVNG